MKTNTVAVGAEAIANQGAGQEDGAEEAEEAEEAAVEARAGESPARV